MTTPKTLSAGMIRRDYDFAFRDLSSTHVAALVATIKRGTTLDPILVWRERDPQGKPSGCMVLLDGAHRMAAYRQTRKNRSIPAVIFEGSRVEAMLEAVGRNARAVLPMTTTERMNAAWRLVWEFDPPALSIAETSRASGVGTTQVKKMRKRKKVMQAVEAVETEFTGRWSHDRKDRDGGEAPERMSDAARRKQVEVMAEALRKTAGMWPKKDRELFADALETAFGYHLREVAEYLYEFDWEREADGFERCPVTGADGDEGPHFGPQEEPDF
ncbi:ParB N-terminal domain-containing protein [Sulfitobacter sp. D35]|uniref:ParB N-terminal domain-containing protein n=1 Tax=Sulfitobacter sp. D35 TaxID=3083252 RepID=UPI00296E7FBA|nr:ParB N-terminal domain-containing protein [Sulfitobacter sp. D35]MDW4497271.1 ParB N-terminal domain-containing protein [Sulfitobacter sp. D35]